MRLMSCCLLAMLIYVPAGCASAAAGGPATRPSTQAAGQRTLRLADAVAADSLEQGDWQLDWQSQIPFKNRPLLFGQLATYDGNDEATATVPVLAAKKDGKWMALKIDDPRLKNAGWSYVAAGPGGAGKDELWGVLDASLDDHQPELVLVHSTDGAETLTIWSLPKPHPAAVFDSFCMDRDGHGRVSMYIYRDQVSRKLAGYYHFRTTDGGRTWSEPEHEPDAMTPAGNPPEDAQKPGMQPAKA